ncbi:MAG: exonuclease [Deltaproteobacteria bacterium]|nr:exonuclease [Deltaproteobacteria bacterium]
MAQVVGAHAREPDAGGYPETGIACGVAVAPRREFEFTYLHGISWDDVATAPTFGEVWPTLVPMLDGAEFLAAHWATFDEGVLRACCAAARLRPPALRFECTVDWAKRAWGLRTAKLPVVCVHLGLRLEHHEAGSDAEACARIMVAARKACGEAAKGARR